MADDRRRWSDALLEERFRGYDMQIETLSDTFAVIRDLPDQVARAMEESERRLERRVTRNEDQLGEVQGAIRQAVEESERHVNGRIADYQEACTSGIRELGEAHAEFVREYREDRRAQVAREEQRASARRSGIVALSVATMGLFGVLIAALITSHTI